MRDRQEEEKEPQRKASKRGQRRIPVRAAASQDPDKQDIQVVMQSKRSKTPSKRQQKRAKTVDLEQYEIKLANQTQLMESSSPTKVLEATPT